MFGIVFVCVGVFKRIKLKLINYILPLAFIIRINLILFNSINLTDLFLGVLGFWGDRKSVV